MEISDLVKSITIIKSPDKENLIVSALDGIDGVCPPRLHFKRNGDSWPLKVSLSWFVAEDGGVSVSQFWVTRTLYRSSCDDITLGWLVQLSTYLTVAVYSREDSMAYIEPIAARQVMSAGQSITL